MSLKPCAVSNCGRPKSALQHSRHYRGDDGHAYQDARTPGLAVMSDGMKEFRKTSGYDAAVKAAKGSPCQVQSPECTGTAEHLHEVRSRGRFGGLRGAYRGPEDGTPCCDACNGYIAENPVWAAERGWLLSNTIAVTEQEEA